MFKLHSSPSLADTTSELADYLEWLAWQTGSHSAQALRTTLNRNNENHRRGGFGDEDDANEAFVAEVMNVVGHRENACNGAYPFRVEAKGHLLQFIQDRSEPRGDIYLYLLLCTRLDMLKHRKLAERDGTALFEKLTADVLHNYLGGGRAKSLVFGTAAPGAFKEKVDRLCQTLGEGGRCRSPDADSPLPPGGDGKLDVVAWIPFHDRRSGKLILFAQSKTGTHWRDTTAQLQPGTFMTKWMQNGFMPEPVRVFCVAEAVDTRWRDIQIGAGILFDRCRMVDFADPVSPEILDEIRVWTQAGRELFHAG